MLFATSRNRPPPEQNVDTIALQLDRWNRAAPAVQDWAEGKNGLPGAKRCFQFAEGDQWKPEDRQTLIDSGRLPVTLNKVSPLTRLINGYFKQNRYQIKYLPGADGTASDDTATSLNYAVQQVGEVNQSKWIDAEVFRDGTYGGRGYFDIRISDARNAFGEIVESALNPFAVFPDPEADHYDPREWGFVQLSHWVTWNDLPVLFSKGTAELVDSRGGGAGRLFGSIIGGSPADTDIGPESFFGQYLESTMDAGRFQYVGTNVPGAPLEHIDRHRKLVRLLETQHHQLRKVRQFVDMQTGVKKTIPDHWTRERIQRVMQYMEFHGLPLAVVDAWDKRVRHTITAADLLLYDDWSPYDSFTVVPYFAYFRRGVTRGMIHDLVDPQQEVNKRRSVFLHFIMTMANPIWVAEEGSLSDEMVETIENEGSRPGLLVTHKKGSQAPKREAGQVNAAPLQVAEKEAANDLREISGINGSALGQPDPTAESGVAIARKQRQTVIGAEDYFDNFSRTRELKGRKYLELIQNWYTEQRLVRVRGEDGKNVDTWINRREAGGRILNDVTLGIYTVAIDEAPLAATMDQAQFDELVTMVKDLGIPVPHDIIVEASNVPRKREIIDRIRPPEMVPPGEPPLPGAEPAAPAPGLETAMANAANAA